MADVSNTGRSSVSKRSLFFCIIISLLVCIFAIPLISYRYKDIIGFYKFKESAVSIVAPRKYNCQKITLTPVGCDRVVVGDMCLFAKWSPTCCDVGSSGLKGVKLNLSLNQVVKVCSYVEPVTNVICYLDIVFGVPNRIIETGYGSLSKFENKYSSDMKLVNALLDKEVPYYLNHESLSMQYPIGYYCFPLFPACKNYRRELIDFALKNWFFDAEGKPTLLVKGEQCFFVFIPRKRESFLLHGRLADESIVGMYVLIGDKELMSKEFVTGICSCFEETALLKSNIIIKK